MATAAPLGNERGVPGERAAGESRRICAAHISRGIAAAWLDAHPAVESVGGGIVSREYERRMLAASASAADGAAAISEADGDAAIGPGGGC